MIQCRKSSLDQVEVVKICFQTFIEFVSKPVYWDSHNLLLWRNHVSFIYFHFRSHSLLKKIHLQYSVTFHWFICHGEKVLPIPLRMITQNCGNWWACALSRCFEAITYIFSTSQSSVTYFHFGGMPRISFHFPWWNAVMHFYVVSHSFIHMVCPMNFLYFMPEYHIYSFSQGRISVVFLLDRVSSCF